MKVVIAVAAAADIAEAATWYEEKKAGLGQEFLAVLHGQLARIRQAPRRCPADGAGLRRALVTRFPYCIHYRIESERVLIVAVLHGKRDPRTPRRRDS